MSDPPTNAVTPKVVVSRCLGFAAVRYDGQLLESRFVEALRDHVEFVRVCPEVEIGMGVPRDPIRIEVAGGERRLVQPSTGTDFTSEMRAFADDFLGKLDAVDGFILKSKSPSCGIVDTKFFAEGGGGGPLGRDAGLFAEAVLGRFPWAAVQDDERLTKYLPRHRFLTHLWAVARLRRVEATGEMSELAAYHAAYENLLTATGEEPRRLGRLVANPGGRSFEELVADYRRELGRALSGPAAFDDVAIPEGFEPYPRALAGLSKTEAGRPV